MKIYKISRNGREFVVYAGDDQVLKCATQKDAEQVLSSVQRIPEGQSWLSIEPQKAFELVWFVCGILIAAAALLYALR